MQTLLCASAIFVIAMVTQRATVAKIDHLLILKVEKGLSSKDTDCKILRFGRTARSVLISGDN